MAQQPYLTMPVRFRKGDGSLEAAAFCTYVHNYCTLSVSVLAPGVDGAKAYQNVPLGDMDSGFQMWWEYITIPGAPAGVAPGGVAPGGFSPPMH